MRRFASLVEAAGYTGHHEVEILSHRLWAEDPDAVIATVKERFANVM